MVAGSDFVVASTVVLVPVAVVAADYADAIEIKNANKISMTPEV